VPPRQLLQISLAHQLLEASKCPAAGRERCCVLCCSLPRGLVLPAPGRREFPQAGCAQVSAFSTEWTALKLQWTEPVQELQLAEPALEVWRLSKPRGEQAAPPE